MDLNHLEGNSEDNELKEVVRIAVEGIVASMPDRVANAIRLGAIPHWFDEKLLARLIGEDTDLGEVAGYLKRLSFVRQDTKGRFRYHVAVRDYLIAWWREERSHQYKEANRKALAYFEASVETASFSEHPTYEREVVYHLLIEDEATGRRYLSTRFEELVGSYQLGTAESFLSTASELTDILTDEWRMWVQYFEARLNLAYGQNTAAEATFSYLLANASDRVLQAVAQCGLGKIWVGQQQWSAAIRVYRASLDVLQREKEWLYVVQVMLALGDAYRDLADSSGGFSGEQGETFSTASHFLYVFEHLPFLLYEWLVQRLSFLPNWYFGTNYQDWIIAYLLIEATSWYHQAEKLLRTISEKQALVDVQLALADIEHQLGRWSRAKRQYATLLAKDEVVGSLYRTACIRLGQGRVFLDEGDRSKAEVSLSQALNIFRQFHDERSIGVTSALLGRVHDSLRRPDQAAAIFVESVNAFSKINNRLALTQVIWDLEDLLQRLRLSEEQTQQLVNVIGQISERNYLARFPDTLLKWFRRLALLVALPLTYVFSFAIALAFTLALIIIEGEFLLSLTGANVQTAFIDGLILSAAVVLPIPLALWFYRLVYSLMGITVVHFLGRRIIPNRTGATASCSVTNPKEITHYNPWSV